MCMKSININNIFYEDDLSSFSQNPKFGEIKTQVKAIKNKDGKYFIGRLYIFCSFTAMSSKEEDPKLTNVYDVMWTFGCVNSDNTFDNKKIAETIFDTTENKIDNSTVSTRSFCNQNRIVELKDYQIEETGKYYLKTYIKKSNTDVDWQIQSITSIDVIV